MSWLFSLFSPRNSIPRKATSSIQDAFSLPTSSPLSPHPDAFNGEALNTPPPDHLDSTMSPISYSYPPVSASGSYDYVPTSSRSRQSTLLPLHSTPFSPLPPYPPLSKTWERLRTWFGREYPELGDTLNWGILPEDLAQIEMQFGFALPGPVRESYLVADGQEPESSAGCSEGLFFGLTLLPLEDVLEEWRFWREVDEDPVTGANKRLRDLMQSIPPGWVKREYSLRGWIPLVTDKGGNYIGIDMNPGEGGAPGQVIVFGRDFDTKVVLWRGDGASGWAKWLASFADDLESGDGFELGVSENSEGSEDDLGYESYFYDGSGRGSGDGGGDTGTGGIRLTGEYKGWSTLEALADRSLRRWHQEGLIPDLSTAQEKRKYSDQMPLATFGLSAAGHGSAAEVPIPVLAEADVSTSELEDATESPSRLVIPTISVTKPPAPLPVDLPTESDIVPISASYPQEVDDDDVEAGQGMMVQEIDPKLEQVVESPRTPAGSSPLAQNVEYSEDAVLVTIPLEPPLLQSPQPLSPSSSECPEVDLLNDEAVMLEMPSPVDPVPSGSHQSHEVVDSKPANADIETLGDEDQDPDTTIRLVGGGGIQGTLDGASSVQGEVEDDSDGDLVEVQSISSIASSDSVAKQSGKHEKKKSSISSGLKKLGKLGGAKRKKGSISSSSTGPMSKG